MSQRRANAAASPVGASTFSRLTSAPFSENTASIPLVVGINSIRLAAASSRRFSPTQVNRTSTRCSRPMVRHIVNSCEVNSEFFKASAYGARSSAEFRSASRRSWSRFNFSGFFSSWFSSALRLFSKLSRKLMYCLGAIPSQISFGAPERDSGIKRADFRGLTPAQRHALQLNSVPFQKDSQ